MTQQFDVTIVGGGIAGLAAAYWLAENEPSARVALVDRAHLLGGKIRTERAGGFVVEGGPDSFLAAKPPGIELCRRLGLEGDLVGTLPGKTARVVGDGRLHPIPEGLSGLIPARLDGVRASTLFTDAGKARFAAEPDVPPRVDDADESLDSFMRRRFGDEVYERLVEPLMAGIYAGDGTELSLAATFPQLRALEREYGSVLRGLQARPALAAAGRSGFLTPRRGMAEFVQALLSRLQRTHLIDAWAASIRRRSHGYDVVLADGETLSTAAVILATPAHVTAEIVADLDPDLAALLAEIPAVSSATVSLGCEDGDRRPEQSGNLFDGTGYIVPRREGGPVLACTWVSNKFPHRAPADYALVRVFLGRRGEDAVVQQPDEELVALAREELRRRLGVTANPNMTWVSRWPNGMPQYSVGHLDRLEAIDRRLEALPGLSLAGAAYRGVGIPDCIASGERAAQDSRCALDR